MKSKTDRTEFTGTRLKRYSTISDKELDPVYTPEDLEGFYYDQRLGYPGEYPYTRGIYKNMYRGRLWTMRQFSGFGTAEETNLRYKYLLEHGQTGLSVAFHMPTIMGYDSDNPRSEGEVGRCGVAIDTLKDMEILFDGIPLDKITTSMTINAPAIVLLAMYIAVAEKQGIDPKVISGTIQNDILKEYIAQKSWIFPPEPSLRIITDIFEYCSEHVPKWNTISISGYHIREAGSTAIQELAFTIMDGITYVQKGIEKGLDIDEFAVRLSFFFDAHNDFFEEIAKFRAARRMWAKIMKERFGAKKTESLRLRFHTQTAGCSLVAQQPMNNIVRVTIQALAAVLGGTQSLHTNSMDETLALPTEQAATVALRTQQIIAEESGTANVIDPLGGSYFIESLTDQMEADAYKYIDKIDKMGGMIEAIKQGYPQREIADAAYKYQHQLENQEKIVVGVNKYRMEDKNAIPTLVISPGVEKRQIKRTIQIKKERNNKKVGLILKRIEEAAKENKNLMPHVLEAVKVYASVGEIMDTMRKVFGEYRDPGIF
ncbi:MAG: methylmalonyl-CoA mutase family protein [Deltaproteobacteria bacterium]|nr:methylmalonyl-CoA mutase family protein [Deltaproteobacteria bacterium]MCL5792867.1 methylmalonyl-CoA mutase family protein [Deltaproteobacteria bacterium]